MNLINIFEIKATDSIVVTINWTFFMKYQSLFQN